VAEAACVAVAVGGADEEVLAESVPPQAASASVASETMMDVASRDLADPFMICLLQSAFLNAGEPVCRLKGRKNASSGS